MLVRSETIEDESLNILKSKVPVPCNSFTSQGVTTISAGLGNRVTFRFAGRPSRKDAITDCNRVRAFSAISKGLPTIQSAPHLFSSVGQGKLKCALRDNHNNCNESKDALELKTSLAKAPVSASWIKPKKQAKGSRERMAGLVS